MSAESDFWAAFEYDHDKDRWMLAERVAPLDLITIVAAKTIADFEEIDEAVNGEGTK